MGLSRKKTLPTLYLRCFYSRCGKYFAYNFGKRHMYCSQSHAVMASQERLKEQRQKAPAQ